MHLGNGSFYASQMSFILMLLERRCLAKEDSTIGLILIHRPWKSCSTGRILPHQVIGWYERGVEVNLRNGLQNVVITGQRGQWLLEFSGIFFGTDHLTVRLI